MHLVANRPAFVSAAHIPATVQESQRNAFAEQARHPRISHQHAAQLIRPAQQALSSGKPTHIASKMVQGWMHKWCATPARTCNAFRSSRSPCWAQARGGLPAGSEVPPGRHAPCQGAGAPRVVPTRVARMRAEVAGRAQDVINAVAARVGTQLAVSGFSRLEAGEGIEREANDFALEVAEAAGGGASR